ncbi:MAG: BtpA/SgcQ family protein [Deinococcales bacterium]
MEAFRSLFGVAKPIIAMAHLPPLPGSPLYDRQGGMRAIVDAVAADLEALQGGGVDAVMFGNEGDRPYLTRAAPESLAAMAAVVAELRGRVTVPFGVDYLWDPPASIALAHATGASFVREVFTGVYDSDMGLWEPDAAAALRLKAALDARALLFYNINAEFAAPLGERSLAAKARSAVFASLADAVCVSGPMTGESVGLAQLDEVKEALPDVPVIANTGVRLENVTDILAVADAAIVGTSLKVGGVTWNPVDRERVQRLMERVTTLR